VDIVALLVFGLAGVLLFLGARRVSKKPTKATERKDFGFRPPPGFGNKVCVFCGTRVSVNDDICTNSKCSNPIGDSKTFTHKAWNSLPEKEAIAQCIEKICSHCGRLNPQDQENCVNGTLCRNSGFLKLTKREIYEELIARETGNGRTFEGGQPLDTGAAFLASGCAVITFAIWGMIALVIIILIFGLFS